MPDWTTHVIAGWITGKATKSNVSLVVVGSLLPDIFKIQLIFNVLQIDTHGFFDPLHTPCGTLLIALLLSLLFKMAGRAFIFLIMGASTHYFLDFFLMHAAGGMKLLFPFSWGEYQLHIISSGNCWVTISALIIGAIFYFIFLKRNGRGQTESDYE